MNLHAIVRPAITTVNPDIEATFMRSAGFTVGASGTQVPVYGSLESVRIQPQAETGQDLKHIQMLNIQGVVRSVYMYGNTQGVVRPSEKGGDLLLFPETPGATTRTWKVVKVVETWPDWSKVIVVMQVGTP